MVPSETWTYIYFCKHDNVMAKPLSTIVIGSSLDHDYDQTLNNRYVNGNHPVFKLVPIKQDNQRDCTWSLDKIKKIKKIKNVSGELLNS